MKVKLCLLMMAMLVGTGCANGASVRGNVNQTNAVQNAVNQQIAKENSSADVSAESKIPTVTESSPQEDRTLTVSETTADPISAAMASIESSRAAEQYKSQEEQMALMKSTEGVDFDLTKMSGDMVYAMVYQLMTEPGEYEGKVFRIRGTYYPSFFESTNHYYHYCIIKDALACCTQGIEFIWEDGSHVYPDEFPKEGDEVEITGTFETYKEGNDERLYCRLNRSTMIVKSGNAGS